MLQQYSSYTRTERRPRRLVAKGRSSYFVAVLLFLVAALLGPTPDKNADHRNSFAGSSSLNAFFTASSATAFTTHSKFSRPTEFTSASGAGFMKSIAYGTPPSTANSTVFRSYPKARQMVRQSFSMRSFIFGDGGGFPFT